MLLLIAAHQLIDQTHDLKKKKKTKNQIKYESLCSLVNTNQINFKTVYPFSLSLSLSLFGVFLSNVFSSCLSICYPWIEYFIFSCGHPVEIESFPFNKFYCLCI
jgi:hypothetical protein